MASAALAKKMPTTVPLEFSMGYQLIASKLRAPGPSDPVFARLSPPPTAPPPTSATLHRRAAIVQQNLVDRRKSIALRMWVMSFMEEFTYGDTFLSEQLEVFFK